MAWPMSQDYNEAIQAPTSNFVDNDLRLGQVVTNALGLPAPCSGNFADVYAVESGQRKWAVKCFTRQIRGLRERYAEISKYLQQVRLPFLVECKYLDQGIRVRGQWYPVLKMEWVEGMPLNVFVEMNLNNPSVMQAISQIWVKMAVALREANLAHGDLQHGNVLLVPEPITGSVGLRLVDYDGMCVPSLEHLKSMEVGHPAYQHPQRLREGVYGLQMDRFSHLVIYTALRGLMVGGRGLWDRFENGDNLLFAQEDFEAPRDSAVFKELLTLNDPVVRKLTAALADAARLPLDQTPFLQDVLPAARAMVPMPYTAEIRRTNPTCFLFLVDQSSSMLEPIGGHGEKSKAQGVADAINRLLQNLVIKCAKSDGIRNYFQVGVIGYGGRVAPTFSGTLAGRRLVPISEVAKNPLRIEQRNRKVEDGMGGVMEQPFKFPVWIEPVSQGKTPMCQALTLAHTIVAEFLQAFPMCYPPLVINITDGEATDGNPEVAAAALRNLGSTDGNVLLFNAYLSSMQTRPIEYPDRESALPDQHSRLLFRMSSVLPPKLQAAAKAEDFLVTPDSRGFVFNADLVAIIRFLDIGTRIAVR